MKKALLLLFTLLLAVMNGWAQQTVVFPGGNLSGTFGPWGGTGHFYTPTFNVDATGGIDIIYYDIDLSELHFGNTWELKGYAEPGISKQGSMSSIDPQNNSVWGVFHNQEVASGTDWNGNSISTLGPDGIAKTSDDTRHGTVQDWYRPGTGGKVNGLGNDIAHNNESYVTPNPRFPSATAKTASELNTYDFRLRVLPTGSGTYTYEMWTRMHNAASNFEGCGYCSCGTWNHAINNCGEAGAWRAFSNASNTVFSISGFDFSSVYIFMGLGNGNTSSAQDLTWGKIEVTGTPTAPPATVWVSTSYYAGGANDGHVWGYDAFDAVQDGVDAVAAGGTVNVAAGTYAGNNIIDKSLTIIGDPGDGTPGPGVNAPVIDGGSAPGDAFKINNGVTNVTIKGFEIRNFTSNANGIGNGISAWVASTSNINIEDNYFHSLGWNGVMVGNDGAIGSHSNWLIKNNILETFYAYGFELTNTSNSSIENNIIHSDATSNPFTCILILGHLNQSVISVKNNLIDGPFTGKGVGFPVIYVSALTGVNLDGITIQQNDIDVTGTAQSITLIKDGTGSVTNVAINYNRLSRLRLVKMYNLIDATNNFWGNENGPINSSVNTYNRGQQAGYITTDSWNPTISPWWKDLSGTPGSFTGTSFSPITNDQGKKFARFGGNVNQSTDAIAGTLANGTLYVEAGTYGENVTIPASKPLTINGQNGTAYIGYASNAQGLILNSPITFSDFSPYSTATNIEINNGGLIQNGVDFALAGGTVKADARTWAEDVTVPAGKPLTLRNKSGTSLARIATGKKLTLASPVTLLYFSAQDAGTLTEINEGGLIQNGIDFAAAGGTVDVKAGSYPEQLLITKALTVTGSDGAVLDGSTLSPGIQWTTGVKIHSGNVTFNNIDVTNYTQDGITAYKKVDMPNIHIKNCKISNIQPGNHGFGIYVGYESEAFKYASNPLTNFLDFSGLLIENNEITNVKSSALVIQAITGTPGTLVVKNNYVHDNTTNSGIWVDCARNIIVQNNQVINNKWGIESTSYGDAYTGNGTTWTYDWTPKLNGPYGPKDNTFTGNIVENNTNEGFNMHDGYPSTYVISNNKFAGNNPGLKNYLVDVAPDDALLIAENNYWGSVNATNVAAQVIGDVDYDPWCNADFSVCGYSATPSAFKNVEQGTYFATLQDAIDGANDGEHIQILAAGDYPGIVFDEGTKTMTVTNESGGTVTIQGASPALTVTSGSVTYNGVSFTTTSDDPAILVNGGNLTLLSCTITASGGYNQDGILVTSGSLDAGTSTTPGHNTFYTPGTGYAVSLTGGTATAIGNYWGSLIPSDIEPDINGSVAYIPWCNQVFTLCGDNGGPITYAPKLIRPAGTVVVPVTVTTAGTLSLTSVSLNVDFNTTYLSFVSGAPGPNMPSGWTFNIFNAGTVTISYYSATPFNLSNNDVVVNLTFTYSGGGDAALTWLERDASSIDLEYSYPSGTTPPIIDMPYYDYQTSVYYKAGYVTLGSISFTREYPGIPTGNVDEEIHAVVTGGTGSYTYWWTGPAGFTPIGGNPVVPGPYGDYTVTATDGNGATISGTYYYGPVHNINTFIDYSTISQGVGAAGTHHILQVDAVDYLLNPLTFNEQVLINKNLTIRGVKGQPVVNYTGTVSGKPTLFDISADGVVIDNMHFNVDLANLRSAVIASAAGIDTIIVKNNVIDCYGTPAGSYGERNAVSINYAGYRVATNGVDNIIFTGNTVNGGTYPIMFRSGISVDEGSGSFTGNTATTINHDILIRFTNAGNVTVTGNNSNGGGMEFSDFNAGAGTLTISGNTFNGAVANTYSNALRLKNNYTARTTTVSGNTFAGFEGNVAGYGGTLSLENYQAVTIDNNTFTPLANSTVFRHITLNTKDWSNSSGFYAPVVGATFTNNTFNGSGTPGGVALAFYNWDNDSPVFNAITIGTAGNENTFNDGIATYILLDNSAGTANPNATTMVPWAVDLDATNNLFAASPPTLPSAMTLAQLFALEDKIQHKIDDQQLGFVLVKASNAYVTDIATATATNNDYTRIRNAVDYVSNNWTINLKGTFDWTETNAAASWALGNDETSGNDDDYCILVPANLNGITFTAPEGLGYATIQGPGDLAAVNLEGFLMFWLGNNQGWTISNLEIFDFDLSIGMFYVGTTDYNNTIITNNHIRIATDLNATVAPVDTYQNMGIHYAFGSNQTISNNIIDIPGNGISDGTNYSATAGIMCNTSGGSVYDGLQITGNTINILNAQSTYPEIILGIWENAHAHSSNITITGNQFLNLAVGNNPAVNLQRGFRVTSHSSASTTVTYSGNTVNGANMGVQWYVPSDYSAQQPISMTANTFTGNWIGIQLQGKGQVTLTNNFINGNLADGIRITDPGSLVTVNNNDFSGNGTWAINNLSSVNLSATCNWYGTASPYAIAPMITGPVNYTPFLVDGTDNDLLSAGFQPVPGSCTGYQTSFYVNDLVLTGDVYTTAIGNDGNSGTPATPFRTLGHAISIASAADTIFVDAGDFPENVTVDKQLDIRGSNYNISPNTGIRVAEAILYPGVSDPDPNTGWPIMYLDAAASGTLINGFTFDGDNPGLTSTLTINGANLDAIEAIAAWDGQSNTSIKNNMVLNFSYAGIELATYPGTLPATTGNLVQDNYIFNILPSIYGMGVITHWNCYTSVLDNVMEEVRIGIQTGNFFQADPGNSRLFDNNDMQVSHRGIYHNANYGSFSPFTFSDNEISAFVFGTETVWEGIRTTALQSGAVNTTICTDNIISGNPSVPSSGYVIWQVNANNAPSITGGTVTGVDKGLWAYNSDWYWGDGSAGAHGTITGVDITTKATGYGVYINDNGTTLHGPVNITVSGCDITALEGVRFEEIVPGTVGGTIDNNDIQASAIGIDVTSCVVSLTNPLVIQNNDLTMVQVAGSPNVGISLNKISGTAATISGNDIVGPFYGYTVYNMNTATPTDIYGGTISGVMQGVSAFNANTSAVWAPSNFKVTGINMSGFAGNHPTIPAANFHSGVYVFTGGTDLNNKVTLVAENVSVDGTGKIQQDCAGMSFADFSGLAGMQDITVMACTLTNNLNRGFNIRAGADVEIMTSTLTNNGGDAFGAGGNDGFGIIARLGATVDVHNNFITNPASVAGSYPVTALFADGGTFTAFENSVTNPGTAYMLAGGADPVAFTATCNWWGSSNLGTISPLISSVVDDYIPWLSDGTDEDLVAVGFQNDNCDGNPIISGWLKYNNAAKTPMNGVTVALKSGASTITTSVTNASGVYTFDDSGIDLGNYTIEVTNNPKAPTSINSTDAAQVNYWATVSKYPIEYTRYLAGDVRGNGLGNPDYFIQAQDAQHIQLRFVNGPSYTGFDRGPWVYWKATTMVSSDGDLGDIAVTVSNANVTQNLYGQVTGDFNMSYIWSPFKNMAANVMLTYGDARQVAASTETELPVRMTDNASLGAVSLVFLYPADLMEVLEVTMQDNPGRLDWLADNGELRIGWNSPVPMSFAAGEALVTIRLRTSENFTLGNAIRLAITADPVNELADAGYQTIPDAGLTIEALEASTLGLPDQPDVNLLTMSARPNPFGAYTHLNYAIPAQGHVTLFISDMTGRKLALLTDQLTAAGQYQYKLDGLPLQPGVYTATLILETSSGDMIKTIKLVRTW